MNKETGGPAFPVGVDAYGEDKTGMTLRDYFAAKVMQGAIADRDLGEELDDFASWAYCVADSMLKAREQ